MRSAGAGGRSSFLERDFNQGDLARERLGFLAVLGNALGTWYCRVGEEHRGGLEFEPPLCRIDRILFGLCSS